ncbi:MAG: hypothetical protein CMO80_09875 [Verrucomicrobiales bacterium]|nr:hypothetical protein [Verrucomicrobiales bacterium]
MGRAYGNSIELSLRFCENNGNGGLWRDESAGPWAQEYQASMICPVLLRVGLKLVPQVQRAVT